jgi:hypothetical protein
MIFNYTDFIFESLILESNVIYSDKFRQTISKIDSSITKSLMDIENKDFNVQSNFFDITLDKNDHISFIPDRKVKEVVGDDNIEYVRYSGQGGWLKHTDSNSEIFGKLGYTPSGDPYSPNSSDVGEVVKKIVSDTSGKTYVWVKFKNSSGEIIGEGVYNNEKLSNLENPRLKEVWTKNRQQVRIGKAIRALLKSAGVEFTDKDIEDFVSKYKSTIDIMNDKFRLFEIVEGKDIGYWYSYENYLKYGGSLGTSCMRSVPKSYFQIYMENPDVCKLVILKSEEDDSKLVARALLWKLTDGKNFLDRIYTIDHADIQLFRDWAKENGIYAKYSNDNSDTSSVFDLDGSRLDLDKLEVKVREGRYDYYPYLDTLKYLNWEEGYLSTERGEDDYVLESTGGRHTTCSECEGEETITCGECDGDGNIECSNCDGDGEVDCSSCDGYGTQDCSECDGSGEVEGADGEEIECSKCDGRGSVNCDDCGGNCKEECDRCDGDGKRECGYCDGEGTRDCPECS